MREFKLEGNFKIVTFEEFVEYGKKNTDNIVNDMPWSFYFEGEPVNHETDKCYLIPVRRGWEVVGISKFTTSHILLVDEMKEFYLVDKATFKTWIDLI